MAVIGIIDSEIWIINDHYRNFFQGRRRHRTTFSAENLAVNKRMLIFAAVKEDIWHTLKRHWL